MRKAYKFRIYSDKKQEELLAKTFGCCRFIYNIMLNDKIKEYEATKKMKKMTPAVYKKEYTWLKEVDSLALANVQLHLEKAYKNFFGNPSIGFPKFKSRHRSRKSYTTNVVNGNIRLENGKIRLPKLKGVKIRKHREIPEGYVLKSVTISQEPSGKYYASLLYEYEVCENQAEKRKEAEQEVLGIDYAMSGMAVFSDGTRCEYPGYFRKAMVRLAREQRKLSRCQKESRNYEKQRKKVARGKKLIKVDRFYPSSKTCSKCGKVKKELSLSERTYECECGNRMDRDVNAAINIREEGKRILCA